MPRQALWFILPAVLLFAPALATRAAEGIATPRWLQDEPLIIVGNWDSMPIFRRRVGGAAVWQEEEYRKEHTEETVRKLKDLGVSMAVLHFYKGFGLEAEKPHIDDARRLAALLHRYGIRVGLYVGSTVAYETFLAEKPEAEEWFAPDYLGQPVFYDDQTFRKRVYFMHPGYREYMKKVLRLGVEDLHADEIDFDNTSMQAQPPIFLHPLAIAQFRDYLRDKYTPETMRLRFGFSETRYILPPRYGRPLRAINDPLFQEWAEFRCHQINAYYAEMAQFIRSLNPNTAIGTNPHSGISGRNTVWDQGIDYPTLLPYMDIPWTEEGNEAAVASGGILISKIRTYKMATSPGKRILTYTAGGGGGKLQMAESMAFNRQCLGMVGGILAGYDLPEDQRRYIRFFRDHFQEFRGVDNIADVAVLHGHASMGFNNDLPWQSSMLFEQVLIQGRVPFDIVFDENLADLSKYRVLGLPDQECLSDEQLSRIRDFVRLGGGLIATEETSLYTPWRERRREFGLADLLQVHMPGAPVRRQAGRGRVVYIPSIRPALPKPPSAPMTSQYWKLPLNWQELLDAVKWAAGGRLSLEVHAPPTVAAEITGQKQTGKLLVHLLNYNAAREPSVRNIEVNLAIPDSKKVASVALLSPDADSSAALHFEVRSGRAVFTVPAVQTYGLAVIQLE